MPEPKTDEDIMDFLQGFAAKDNQQKKDQWLRDKYPGLFPPKK